MTRNNFSSDQCVVDYNSVNGLSKQSGFSIAQATEQYCNIALLPVKELILSLLVL